MLVEAWLHLLYGECLCDVNLDLFVQSLEVLSHEVRICPPSREFDGFETRVEIKHFNVHVSNSVKTFGAENIESMRNSLAGVGFASISKETNIRTLCAQH